MKRLGKGLSTVPSGSLKTVRRGTGCVRWTFSISRFALQMGATELMSFDENQRQVALAEGMAIVP